MIDEEPEPRFRDSITVELIGGLGNQLFQYGTALTQSRRLGCPLLLDVSYFDTVDHRSFALEAMPHEGTAVSDPRSLLTARPTTRRVRSWAMRRRHELLREASYRYDPRVRRVRPGTRLEGYFQSWRYFDEIGHVLRSQIHGALPDWTAPGVVALDPSKGWIAVNVRRGDYLADRYRGTFGVTGWPYLVRAVALVRRLIGPLPAIVVSDEPPLVRAEMGQLPPESVPNFHVLDNQDTPAKALDDLMTLSHAAGVVLSNSSFSWWGGYLGERSDRPVVAPRPWFINLPHDTRDLLLPDWLTLDVRDVHARTD